MSDPNATPCQEAPEAWVGDNADLRAEAAKECARCPIHMFTACQKLAKVDPFGVMAGVDYGVKIKAVHDRHSPGVPDTKECPVCGVTIKRGRRGKADWAKLRFCSRKCYGTTIRLKGLPEVKTCQQCGGDFTRGSRSATQFLVAMFCGVNCAGAARRKVKAA